MAFNGALLTVAGDAHRSYVEASRILALPWVALVSHRNLYQHLPPAGIFVDSPENFQTYSSVAHECTQLSINVL
jgi:hypothetical protein